MKEHQSPRITDTSPWMKDPRPEQPCKLHVVFQTAKLKCSYQFVVWRRRAAIRIVEKELQHTQTLQTKHATTYILLRQYFKLQRKKNVFTTFKAQNSASWIWDYLRHGREHARSNEEKQYEGFCSYVAHFMTWVENSEERPMTWLKVKWLKPPVFVFVYYSRHHILKTTVNSFFTCISVFYETQLPRWLRRRKK